MNTDTNYSRHYSRRKKLASLGEQCAADYLSNRGYTIIARNWQAGRLGEIDLIAGAPEGTLVFVEVKTRAITGASDYGIYPLGFEAIDRNKQLKIIRSAWRFQQTTGLWSAARFDAVVVIYRRACGCYDQLQCLPEPEIIHVPNAFAPR